MPTSIVIAGEISAAPSGRQFSDGKRCSDIL
jgi:hypothetical protein